MTTPINQLGNTMETDLTPNDTNSQIVTEILNEMNANTDTVELENNGDLQDMNQEMDQNVNANLNHQEEVYMESQQQQFDRQMDPEINLRQGLENNQNEVTELPEVVTVTVNNTDSMKDKLLKKLLDPSIVVAVVFGLNLPIFKTMLAKYLPKLFGEMVTNSVRYMSEFLKALIIGVIFFGVKSIM